MDDVTDPLATAPWRRFAVLGDSIAAGVGDPVEGHPDGGWAAALDRARPGLAYRNLGERGLVAAEVRDRQLDTALAFGPDLAAVSAGGNDLLAPAFDAGGVEAALDAIVGALRGAGADVITFSLFDITAAGLVPEPYPAPLRRRLRALADRAAAVAARHGAIHLDGMSHPVSADPSIYSADLTHLNAYGHAVFAAEVLEALTVRSGACPGPPASPAARASRRAPRARATSAAT